jgi:hypothetical protein
MLTSLSSVMKVRRVWENCRRGGIEKITPLCFRLSRLLAAILRHPQLLVVSWFHPLFSSYESWLQNPWTEVKSGMRSPVWKGRVMVRVMRMVCWCGYVISVVYSPTPYGGDSRWKYTTCLPCPSIRSNVREYNWTNFYEVSYSWIIPKFVDTSHCFLNCPLNKRTLIHEDLLASAFIWCVTDWIFMGSKIKNKKNELDGSCRNQRSKHFICCAVLPQASLNKAMWLEVSTAEVNKHAIFVTLCLHCLTIFCRHSLVLRLLMR